MNKKAQKMEKAVTLLKTLAHPVRLSLLCNMLENGEMSVTDLVSAEKGSVSQSQVSQFLAKIKAQGLISCRKEAQTVYYFILAPEVKKLISAMHDIYCKR
jgi:DNA-binding transcriptional ArsR family regulator